MVTFYYIAYSLSTLHAGGFVTELTLLDDS